MATPTHPTSPNTVLSPIRRAPIIGGVLGARARGIARPQHRGRRSGGSAPRKYGRHQARLHRPSHECPSSRQPGVAGAHEGAVLWQRLLWAGVRVWQITSGGRRPPGRRPPPQRANVGYALELIATIDDPAVIHRILAPSRAGGSTRRPGACGRCVSPARRRAHAPLRAPVVMSPARWPRSSSARIQRRTRCLGPPPAGRFRLPPPTDSGRIAAPPC
jgi:hypothetical protein